MRIEGRELRRSEEGELSGAGAVVGCVCARRAFPLSPGRSRSLFAAPLFVLLASPTSLHKSKVVCLGNLKICKIPEQL